MPVVQWTVKAQRGKISYASRGVFFARENVITVDVFIRSTPGSSREWAGRNFHKAVGLSLQSCFSGYTRLTSSEEGDLIDLSEVDIAAYKHHAVDAFFHDAVEQVLQFLVKHLVAVH